jgi:gliding motility-associated-like protein
VPNPTAILNAGNYYIKSKSTDGCTVIDSVYVTVKLVPINPPNAFSPNKDGINDQWEIPDLHNFPDCTVDVYNRTGQLVFHSKGYQQNWNGTYKNQALPVGTYYYIIKASPIAMPQSGSVTILR